MKYETAWQCVPSGGLLAESAPGLQWVGRASRLPLSRAFLAVGWGRVSGEGLGMHEGTASFQARARQAGEEETSWTRRGRRWGMQEPDEMQADLGKWPGGTKEWWGAWVEEFMFRLYSWAHHLLSPYSFYSLQNRSIHNVYYWRGLRRLRQLIYLAWWLAYSKCSNTGCCCSILLMPEKSAFCWNGKRYYYFFCKGEEL